MKHPAMRGTQHEAIPRHRRLEPRQIRPSDAVPFVLWVPTILSTSRDQAIFVDRATGASLSSCAVLPENDRLW